MHLKRLAVGASLFALSGVARADGPPREVAMTELTGKSPIALSLQRIKTSDGGLKLRLIVSAKKKSSVTVYEGGGDDDGPSDKAFKSANIEPFSLPGGVRGARIDFEFQVPGSKKHRQVDTYLVSLEDAPKLVLDTTTRRERDRTKVCHEVEVSTLTLEKDGKLYVKPVSALESELDDDDLPVDKSCKGKRPGQQVTFKWDGEVFLQIDPPLAKPKKKSAEDEESDD
jgi:hypothetical protein